MRPQAHSPEPNLPGLGFDSRRRTQYNYFRDYDPAVGRYVQSDPIGLRGGINTYGYVGANPTAYFDKLGLDRWYDPSWGGGAGENWWWNCPGQASWFKKTPAVTVPWFGAGPPRTYDERNNNFCLWRPPHPKEGCRLVAAVICTGASMSGGFGMPYSTMISQGCQVILKPVCDQQSCSTWPESSQSPFGYGP